MRNISQKNHAGPRSSPQSPCKHRNSNWTTQSVLTVRSGSSRFAQLNLSQTYLPFAHRARVAVHRNIDRNTGKLQKVCSIYDERQMREESAEGQAFVVLMEAAWRDWSEGRGRAE